MNLLLILAIDDTILGPDRGPDPNLDQMVENIKNTIVNIVGRIADRIIIINEDKYHQATQDQNIVKKEDDSD